MLNRRELLVSSIALSVAARAQAASGPSAGQSGHACCFVASRDLPEARLAAAEAEALGATVLWLDADVTPVYTALDLALRPAPFAVAGLTSAHHFFLLERLGWDRGLRTARRQERGTALDWLLEPKKGV